MDERKEKDDKTLFEAFQRAYLQGIKRLIERRGYGAIGIDKEVR